LEAKKLFVLKLFLAILTGLGMLVALSPSTSASTWHKGVPKLLYGRWENKYAGFHFYKKSFVAWDRQIGYVPTAYARIKVTYKVVGRHTYRLHSLDIRSNYYHTAGDFHYINESVIKIVGGGYLYRY
jgi:hypothetical protein